MKKMLKFLSGFLILTMILTLLGNIVLASDGTTAPTQIDTIKIENFARFGASGRLNTTAFDMVTDANILGAGAPVVKARGIQRNGSATDSSGNTITIGTFGIRSNAAGTFTVAKDNTYVLVTYWVKSNLNGSTAGTPLIIKPYMFYYNGKNAKGSYPVLGKSSAEEITLEDGKWYKAYNLFKLKRVHMDEDTECTDIGFRMDIGAAALLQQTFVGGLEAWDFGTAFSYGDITDTEAAIKAYVADNTAKSITYGGVGIEGFDSDVTGYVVDKVVDNAIAATVNGSYAEIISNAFDAESGVATVEIGSNAINGYTLYEQNTYANTKEYKIWLRESSDWSIGVALPAVLTEGENFVDIDVANTGTGTAKLYAVVYDTATNAVCDVDAVDVSTSDAYRVAVNAPASNACMEVFIADSATNKPLTPKKTLIGTPSDTAVTGNIVEVKDGELTDAFPLRIGVVAKADTSEDIVFADVVEANHEGKYAFSFIPKEVSETKFTLYITDEKSGAKVSKPFEYYSDNAVKAAVEWFETATEAQVQEVLDVEGKLVNGTIAMSYLLSTENNTAYTGLKGNVNVDRALVYKSLAGKTFADKAALNTAFKAAVDDLMLCKMFGEAPLEDVTTEGEPPVVTQKGLKTLVKEEGTGLGLYMTKSGYGFNEMTDAHYEALITTLQGKYYPSKADLTKSYNDALVLYIFNNYAWDKLEGAVSEYKDLEELNLDTGSDNYLAKTSTPTLKSDFYKTLANATYTKLDDIKTTFNNTVNAEEDGGGGGGGGGGGAAPKPPIDDFRDNDDKNDEQMQPPTQPEVTVPVFGDLAEGHWAEEYILDLHNRGIVSGDDKGNFNSEAEITRAEYVKMLVLSLNHYDANADAEFKDSNPEDWHYSYIASGVKAGIIQGVGNGRFGADEPVSRQDMAVLAYRAISVAGLMTDNIADESVEFSDKDTIADYAVEGVEAMQGLGIINGMGDNKFVPEASSTRAMAAKVISLILNLNSEQEV